VVGGAAAVHRAVEADRPQDGAAQAGHQVGFWETTRKLEYILHPKS
jgi:hypothetical protein